LSKPGIVFSFYEPEITGFVKPVNDYKYAMNVRFLTLFFFLNLTFGKYLAAQLVYVTNAQTNEVFTLDMQSCALTSVVVPPAGNFLQDITFGINGDMYFMDGSGFYSLDLNTGAATLLGNFFCDNLTGLATDLDGTIYAAGNGLCSWDPNTGQFTYYGEFNNYLCIGDLMFYNGQLYMAAVDLNNFNGVLLAVDIANPGASTPAYTMPGPNILGLATVNTISCGTLVYAFEYENDPPHEVFQVNMNTGVFTPVCALPSGFAGACVPLDYIFDDGGSACCITDAGSAVNNNLIQICGLDNSATFLHNQDEILDQNDGLEYVLYSNPNNPSASILQTNDTPEFYFNANNMVPGAIYYLAAIAGNNNGGQVALNDPCFSMSDSMRVRWRPAPTVVLSTNNPNICPAGCVSLTANFTGSPPFSFTLESQQNNMSLFTQNYLSPSNVFTFQFCTGNSNPGPLQAQVVLLQDGFCICQE
jgi:hypothetical protein